MTIKKNYYEEYFKDALILKLCNGKKVLHMGAADDLLYLEKGSQSKLLHQKLKKVSRYLLGLDINRKAIDEIKKRFGITDILEADITKSLINKNLHGFDVIVMGDILEHLSNPGLALDSIREIMNKKTELIVTVPNCYCYDNIINIFRSKEKVYEGHMFWPSGETMSNLFLSHGLRIKEFRYVNYGSYDDIKTIKGRLFVNTMLKHIKKIRSTLFFVLKRN